MLKEFLRKKGALLFLIILILPLILQGCGGGRGSYDIPSTTESPTVIAPATLKSWIDSGKVNGTGYDRVVILDVTSSESLYSAGHIPGAQYLNTDDITQTRSEGVIYVVNQILDGSTMDALLQKYEIDGKTTVVFTSASPTAGSPAAYLYVGRAYFTFRYWGFPKERLKVLDGLNAAYASAGYELSTASAGRELSAETSLVARSTYSVTQNPSIRTDLNASLQEMIDLADGKGPANALSIDGR